MIDYGVLKISNPEDREEVAKILFKNGYEVSRRKRKVGKKIIYDVVFNLKEDENDD